MTMIRRSTVFFVLLLVGSRLSAAEVKFHFIYIGQGDCTLIQTPDGKNILVDCGSSRDGDTDETKQYIETQIGPGGKIDVLVISHPDSDHYNMLPDVLQGIAVDKVLYVGTLDEYPSSNFGTWLRNHPNRKRLRQSHADAPGHVSTLFPQGDVKFHILSADVGDEKNARSIVLLVSYRDFDVIMTGDATAETEADILDRYSPADLDCELLKVGHHGSTTSSTQDFLQAIRPETATVSAAYHSQFAHPRKVVIDRISQFTGDAPSHQFRWGTGSGNSARLRNVNNFREAIFTTATSGTFVITSDGSHFGPSLDEEPAAPNLFAAVPRQPASPARSAPTTAPPEVATRSAERVTDTARAMELPPVEVGKPIEITLRSGATVSGTLKEAPKPTWFIVTEQGTSKAVYVRESDVAMVKQ